MKKILAAVIKVWMTVGKAIGWAVSNLILLIVYCLVFIPVSIVMRILRRDPLKRRFLPQAETYWIIRHRERDGSFKLEQCKHMY